MTHPKGDLSEEGSQRMLTPFFTLTSHKYTVS